MHTEAHRATALSMAPVDDHEAEYAALISSMQASLSSAVHAHGNQVFTTDATDLFEAYLGGFDVAQRQHHNCRACRQFIEQYGGLVSIDEAGQTTPLLWDPLAEGLGIYAAPTYRVASIVAKARVTGVFASEATIWGSPQLGGWSHLSVTPVPGMIHRRRDATPHQVMAKSRQDYTLIQGAISAYKPDVVAIAAELLEGDHLYRSSQVMGPVVWLRALQARAAGAKKPEHRRNMVWREAAVAPAGFAHVRNGMGGTLMDDIASGMAMNDVKKRFAAKMDPTQYLRPQAAPSAGNIAQAERLVDKLGIKDSLRRRWLRRDEVQAFWRPAPAHDAPPSSGVFGRLRNSGDEKRAVVMGPARKMTWRSFVESVVPRATAISIKVPRGYRSFCAMLTQAVDGAPPIIRWDKEDRRNPVSWYLYTGGSPASQWNLPAGQWVDVLALADNPSQWALEAGEDPAFAGAMLVIDGAFDAMGPGGLSLFPEILSSALHPIRSTIEAHSKSGIIEGDRREAACGLSLGAGEGADLSIEVRVTAGPVVSTYEIDRWA